MMMRKIYMKLKSTTIRFFLVGIVSLFSVTACEDALETKVYSELSPDNFFKTESDFNSALITLYSVFSTNWGWNDPGAGTWYTTFYNADIKSYWVRSMLVTDVLASDGEPDLQGFSWGPSTWLGYVESTYSKIRYVSRATDLIHQIENVEGVDESVKARYLAETKVLRAWIMCNIYDFYGPVNVKLDPETLASNKITPRLSDEEYVGRMLQDLNEAIQTPDFPEMHNNSPENWGRVSKGVARMLMLKIHMHKKQWSQAEAVGKELIAMDYQLLTDSYQDVFTQPRNSELIYAVPASGSQPNYYPTEVLPTNFASSVDGEVSTETTGWYVYWMPWDYYDTFFSEGDARRETILTSYVSTGGNIVNRESGQLRGAIPLKYTELKSNDTGGGGYGLDHVVFRLGEVYLSVAEAINEQRGPGEAYEYVNQIRERAGVEPLSGLSQDDFRQAVLDERGRELYAEGVRRQDLIRHGRFISNAVERGFAAQPHMVLFPIPSNVIIEGEGTIEQNPGYN
jgi:hypothetical protein